MMADIAANYAEALEASFDGSVDVLGISTSGSVASSSPRTIPVFCAGWCSLGPPTGWVRSLKGLNGAGRSSRPRGTTGAAWQRRRRHWWNRGRRRGFSGSVSVGGSVVVMGRGWDPSDMIATIRVEDGFDVADRLGRAPTLLIAGDRDRTFGMEHFKKTAALILSDGSSAPSRR